MVELIDQMVQLFMVENDIIHFQILFEKMVKMVEKDDFEVVVEIKIVMIMEEVVVDIQVVVELVHEINKPEVVVDRIMPEQIRYRE